MRKTPPLRRPPAAWTPRGLIAQIIGLFDRIPHAFVAFAARVFPAAVFWQSGQTKFGWLARVG